MTASSSPSLRENPTTEFDPFSGGEVIDWTSTTDSQREILTTVALGGEAASLGYNEAISLHFEGPLHVPTMKHAIATVTLRHDAFRAVFSDDGKIMTLLDCLAIPIDFEDLSDVSEDEKKARVERVAQEEGDRGFDLHNGPLARTRLLRLDPQRHALFVTAHHVIYDGWSAGVLLADLAVSYNALLNSREPAFEPASSFFEYANAEKAFAKSAEFEGDLDFWRDQYREPVQLLRLPRDGGHSTELHSEQQYEAGRYDHPLDTDLVEALRKLGREERCSLFVTLLASYEAYLFRISGQSDFSVGYPVAGQSLVEAGALVGHCVNLLPLRAKVDGQSTFRDLLRSVRQTFLEASEHQRITFGRLVKELSVQRVGGRIPLATTTFNLDTGIDNVEFRDLDFRLASVPRAANSFELGINASDLRTGYVLECSYWKSSFREETIARRMREFEVLMRDVVQRPRAKVSELQLLSEQDRSQVIECCNDTSLSFFPESASTVMELFDAQVSARPEAPCSTYLGRTLSYAEVGVLSRKFAKLLIERGVQPGSRVAVCIAHDETLPAVLLGVMRAGAAYVPIDPSYPAERVASMIEDAAPKLAVVDADSKKIIEACSLLSGEQIFCVDADDAETVDIESPMFPAVSGQDIAYVIYTSGSTGRPKGTLIPHASLANLLCATRHVAGHRPEDRCLVLASIAFDWLIWDLFVPLIAGSTCVIADRNMALDPKALIHILDRNDVTVFNATPATWRMLVDAGWRGKSNLRATTGGEDVSLELVSLLRSRVAELWNAYGPTETTVLTTLHKFESADPPVLIGAPLPNYRCYVLDERREPVPVGVPGELWIAGVGVSAGYLNRPELNQEKFVPDPFVVGKTMYRTGDRVRWHDPGLLQWLGRIDSQVKVRGYRIELGEIESVLCEVEGVTQAVARAVSGPEGNVLVAYVQAAREMDRAARDERAALWKRATEALGRRLPHFMIPTKVIFVDSFALGTTGKIDRHALPEVDVAGQDDGPGIGREGAHLRSSLAEPRTPVEEALMRAWSTVLKRPVSVFDNFFAIGGSSMDAIRIVQEASAQGLDVSPAAIVRHPSVAELARVAQLRVARTGVDKELVVLREHGSKPPLYLLHSLPGDLLHYGALVQALEDDRPVYGFQCLSALDAIPQEEWSVRSLAQHFASVVQQFQPKGPYHLAGWCFGGLVAIEVALALRAAGANVGLVGLLETWPYRTRRAQALRRARNVLRLGRNAMPVLRRKLQEQLSVGEPRKGRMDVFALDADSGPFRNRSEVYRRNRKAVADYRSTFFAGRVTLVRTANISELEESDYGWSAFATRVDVRTVNAEHEEILRVEHAPTVARVLQEQLASIEKASVQPPRSGATIRLAGITH